MNNLDDFAREAARRYLQSVVFVDDQIYVGDSGRPVESAVDLPAFKSPYQEDPELPIPAGELALEVSKDVPYRPKQLAESFAQEGIVCALYEPTPGFDASKNSEIFNLCERADVVILDWDLFNERGKNILPLISGLVDQSQTSVPHHVRLCIIYTSTPDLSRVTNEIFEKLEKKNSLQLLADAATVVVAGATRIVVLGKPNAPGRTEKDKEFEVEESNLASRVINEFSKMHRGLLPSAALYGMGSVRSNAKRILDKFKEEVDGPFLVQRALIRDSEDALEQIPELLAEELLAVIADQFRECVAHSDKLIESAVSTLPLANLSWSKKPGSTRDPKDVAREFLRLGGDAGIKVVQAECEVGKTPFERKFAEALHAALDCDANHSDKKLAMLYTLRTRYFEKDAPPLTFGTLVRVLGKEQEKDEYAVCVMPLCDAIRLKKGSKVRFPFWKLGAEKKGAARGIVIKNSKDEYLLLHANAKSPGENIFIEDFVASDLGIVSGQGINGSYFFESGTGQRLEWVGQLKPAHAQRVAHDIGQVLSRIGLSEAEWLRLLMDRTS